jgi:hypothetical protein
MLNASAALAPWLLLGCLAARRGVRIASVALVIATQLVHYAQPDAGQATALALGALPLVLDRGVIERHFGVPCAALLVALAVATWAERDPLAPVEHVERILFLTAARGPLWIAAMIAAAAAMLVPLVWPPDRRAPLTARASGVLYIAATFAVTFAGDFPVPAFGAGAAPLLGWYAMLAVCRSER